MMEGLLNFFVSNAYAAEVPMSQPGGGYSFLIMFAGFFILVYFAIWRPQSKRAKEQQALLSSIVKGDEVVTAGGMLGRVTKISDQYVGITVANNMEILLQKSCIVTVLPKGTLNQLNKL